MSKTEKLNEPNESNEPVETVRLYQPSPVVAALAGMMFSLDNGLEFGARPRARTDEEAFDQDREALESDWRAVGRDFQAVIGSDGAKLRGRPNKARKGPLRRR